MILWCSKHILSHCEGSQKCFFSCPLRSCYTTIQPFCDRGAANSKGRSPEEILLFLGFCPNYLISTCPKLARPPFQFRPCSYLYHKNLSELYYFLGVFDYKGSECKKEKASLGSPGAWLSRQPRSREFNFKTLEQHSHKYNYNNKDKYKVKDKTKLTTSVKSLQYWPLIKMTQ